MDSTTVRGNILYECSICSCYHPWEWAGDCRDDANRVFPDDYAEFMEVDEYLLEIRDMDERTAADLIAPTTWDINTATAILEELRHLDVYTRLYGNGWERFLDKLTDKYGIEPDMRPRLNIRIEREA